MATVIKDIIEAAIDCIADTSWGTAHDERRRLYHALKEHLGVERFRELTDKAFRRTHAAECAWHNAWYGFMVAGKLSASGITPECSS